MPRPFDATMRELFELEPAAWLEFLRIPVADPGQVQVIESNLSTVAAEADKVVLVGGEQPMIVHTEFLSSRDADYPEQAAWYNRLLAHRHRLPVWSVLVLLRPKADSPELTGIYEQEVPARGKNLWFRYDVIRIWLEEPQRLLASGLPLLPLAPVSNVAADRLVDVLTAVASRLRDEAGAQLTMTLWTATAILTGLRYPREQVGEMIEGVAKMVLGIRGIEDSWVYQDILAKGRAEGEAMGRAEGEAKGRAEGEAKGRAEGEAKGRAEGQVKEAREILLGLGREKLGEPHETVLAKISALSELDQLNRLLHRILSATSWEELMRSTDQ